MQSKKNKRFSLTNPWVFWSIVLSILLLLLIANKYLSSSQAETTKGSHTNIVEQSFELNDRKPIVIDPDNLQHMDIERNKVPYNDSTQKKNFFQDRLLYILILYTILLSLLFAYREKEHRKQVRNQEVLDDELQLLIAKQKGKTYVFESLADDIEKHKNILEPELKIEKIEAELNNDVNYIIINARIILEKTMLKLYKYYFNEDPPTLNDMMYILHKKRVLTPAMNSYAHTIKAFGNKAIHPTLDPRSRFEPKDGLLVLSSLLQYLEDLKSTDLPEK